MKKTLFTAMLFTTMALTNAHAKSFFGTIDRYIINSTNKVIEIGSNDIEAGVATYYDYTTHEKKTIDVRDISKSTSAKINGVRGGDTILINANALNPAYGVIERMCLVFNVFENGRAQVGCTTSSEADYQNRRLDYIINDLTTVTAEVDSLDGFKKGERVELKTTTRFAKSGRNVVILAIFANGEALIRKTGLSFLDTNSNINKLSADKVALRDLGKL